MRGVLLFLFLFLTAAVTAGADGLSFQSTFQEKHEPWQLDRRVAEKPSLTWTTDGSKSGLRFKSQGTDLLMRPFRAGKKSFEFVADVELTKGHGTEWPRYKGVNITISSAPVDKMKKDDWAIVISVVQSGIMATVKKGGARYATLRYKTENLEVYKWPGKSIKPARPGQWRRLHLRVLAVQVARGPERPSARVPR